MSAKNHFYRPSEGHDLAHNPFNSIVAPRPIGWISTRGLNGVANLAPYSFFNAFNYVPPIVGFCSIGYKDSVRNSEETGEFCWNLVTRANAESMNATSASVDPEIDEFELVGLTATACTDINVPRVAESPVAFECRVTQIIQLNAANQTALDTHMVFGEVVAVHIDQSLIVDGMFDTVLADPLLRGGGPADYFTISAEGKLQMHRPT